MLEAPAGGRLSLRLDSGQPRSRTGRFGQAKVQRFRCTNRAGTGCLAAQKLDRGFLEAGNFSEVHHSLQYTKAEEAMQPTAALVEEAQILGDITSATCDTELELELQP